MIDVDKIEASIPMPTKRAAKPPRTTSGPSQRWSRARKYLATMDPAIQGQNGSGSLWQAVCRMMHGFALDDGEVRDLITNEYNPRCDPPWSDAEIDHKICDAREKGEADKWQVEDRPLESSPPPRRVDAPEQQPARVGRTLAEIFIELYDRKDEPTVMLTLGGLDVAELDLDSMAVIIGGPGRGKTSLALAFAAQHARHVGPVVIVSVELRGRQLGARMLGTYDAQSWRGTLRGAVPRDRADELAGHLGRLRVLDGSEATIANAQRAVTQLRAAHPGESILVVVDYVQILPAVAREVRERVASSIEACAVLARDERVAVVALSQSSRAGARALGSGDLVGADTIDAGAETAAIERWASITLALGSMSAPAEDGAVSVDLSAGKGRYGDGDRVVKLRYEGRTGAYRIAGDWQRADEVRAERAGDKDSKKVSAAMLAIGAATSLSAEPLTREDLKIKAHVKKEIATAAIDRLLASGEIVEVQSKKSRAQFWRIWTRERAEAAGVPIVARP